MKIILLSSIYLLSFLFSVGQTPKLVKDIANGSQSSGIYNILSVDDFTFFIANDFVNGNELWRTDGTTANTNLFKDFTPANINQGNTRFGFMTVFKGYLYVQVNGGGIWRTDGTQITLFKNFPPSSKISSPSIVIGDYLYFVGSEYINGNFTDYELYKTDGVTTTMVKDINPGITNSSSPENFCNVNGTLFFTAYEHTNGTQLWKSDGSSAGTVMVKNIDINGNYTSFSETMSSNGLVFFMTNSSRKLWRSDGTATGTFLLYDAGTNYMGGNSSHNMISFKNKMYFKGFEYQGDGELWESDGSVAGTKLTKNINPYSDSYPNGFKEVNGVMYFNANNKFWKSDGTANGTVEVWDRIRPTVFYNINNTLYLSGGTFFDGYELWKSDGTSAGTTLVADMAPGNMSSYAGNLHLNNNKLYLTAEVGSLGGELYIMNLQCADQFNLNISENYSNGTLKINEAKSITATNRIGNGVNATYKAGEYISLNSGFQADSGSIFKTDLTGCK